MTKINCNIDLEIKECPFCGDDPLFFFTGCSFGEIDIFIKCKHGCASKYNKIHYEAPIEEIQRMCQEVIKKWNTRAKER